MSAEYFLFLIVVVFVIFFFIATIYTYYLYKKHLNNYEDFFKQYRRNGLYIDSISNLSSDFGFVLYYLKIAFFVRLLQDKKMYVEKGKLVDKACYEYMHNLPKEKTAWMWSWRRAHFIQAFLFVISLVLGFLHSIFYHY